MGRRKHRCGRKYRARLHRALERESNQHAELLHDFTTIFEDTASSLNEVGESNAAVVDLFTRPPATTAHIIAPPQTHCTTIESTSSILTRPPAVPTTAPTRSSAIASHPTSNIINSAQLQDSVPSHQLAVPPLGVTPARPKVTTYRPWKRIPITFVPPTPVALLTRNQRSTATRRPVTDWLRLLDQLTQEIPSHPEPDSTTLDTDPLAQTLIGTSETHMETPVTEQITGPSAITNSSPCVLPPLDPVA